MTFPTKTLGLLLASLTLASCGGGGGNGGAFSAPQNGSITLTADRTSLPLNAGGILPFLGSPYMATVVVSFRSSNGTLEAPSGDATFTIDNPNIATLSEPDDPATTVNEFTARFATFHEPLNNGSFTVFVTSLLTPGTATLTVSAVDPQTNVTVSKTLPITVSSGIGTSPASVALSPSTTAVYLPSSGGGNTSVISALVLDGAGIPVANPTSGNAGVDNVLFEIVGTEAGATLTANSASGSVTATSVYAHTLNGIATASFQAGDSTPEGPIEIRATVDRADNNVSNGIQDPVSSTTSVIVSDGKLASVSITSPLFSPALPGITINSLPVSGDVAPPVDGTIPANPDGTLSLVITAKASDHQGNPVLAGTPLRFGLIDTPVSGFDDSNPNNFELEGTDGNPQPGGTAFSAPTGQFLTAGGGAQVGDALLVFGKFVDGFSDLENAVSVARVNNQTSLTVSPAFNPNDGSGVVVAPGPILPYVIGRSGNGNSITTTAATDASGIAHATLTYTVQSTSAAVAIWAEGSGAASANGAHQITDILLFTYPGVAPASISASPDPIIGDASVPVTICVVDALQTPLRGFDVGFAFQLPNGGTGTVDGHSSGALANRTGEDGCVTATVTTSGLPATGDGVNSGTVTFSAAGQTAIVDIVVQVATLQVSPSQVAVPSAGSTTVIKVTALTADGTPSPNVDITGTCTTSNAAATLTPSAFTGTTDGSGSITDSVAAAGFVVAGTPPTTYTGKCTFTTAGSHSATVTFNGGATCDDFSPPNCGGGG